MAPFPELFLLLRQPGALVVPCLCPWWWYLQAASASYVPIGCTCRRPAAPSRDAAGCQAWFRSRQAFSAARLFRDLCCQPFCRSGQVTFVAAPIPTTSHCQYDSSPPNDFSPPRLPWGPATHSRSPSGADIPKPIHGGGSGRGLRSAPAAERCRKKCRQRLCRVEQW